MNAMVRITALFPLWALLGALLAWIWPEPLVGLRPTIVPLLGLVMLGMGMTLTPANFTEVLRRPGAVALGVGLQYLIMPLAGWLVARMLGLPPALLAGLVLVGSCPGGTASNVVCYLARGDVALSITLTTLSTLLAVFMTPLLTWFYVGHRVPVPVLGMLWSIVKVVLLPVAAGVTLNRLWHDRLHPLKHLFPLISVLAIVVIIAIITALNHDRFPAVAPLLLVAVMAHNLLGLGAGYGLARLARRSRREARTLAIEVGMQNSGLAVVLAAQHFSALASLPGALFSIWHNLSGAVLAGHWARRRLEDA